MVQNFFFKFEFKYNNYVNRCTVVNLSSKLNKQNTQQLILKICHNLIEIFSCEIPKHLLLIFSTYCNMTVWQRMYLIRLFIEFINVFLSWICYVLYYCSLLLITKLFIIEIIFSLSIHSHTHIVSNIYLNILPLGWLLGCLICCVFIHLLFTLSGLFFVFCWRIFYLFYILFQNLIFM